MNTTTTQQARSQRLMRGVTEGLKFLNDEAVSGPTHYSEGLSDLKWFLRLILQGQVSINFDPQDQTSRPTDSAKKIGSLEVGDEKKDGAGADSAAH